MRSWQHGMQAQRTPAPPADRGGTPPTAAAAATPTPPTHRRHTFAQRIRWQAAISLGGIAATSALLALQGMRLSRLDLVAIGAAVLVLAGVALLFGREAPAPEGRDGSEVPRP
jgi:hypothetical protein